MTPLELSIPFGLGVVSSLHCTQMCGPIVLSYSLPVQKAGKSLAGSHLLYNAGRLLTYAALGAAAGASGSGMVQVGRLAGVEKTAAIVAGCFMIVAGLLVSGLLSKRSLVQVGAPPGFFSRMAGRILRAGANANKFVLGLLMGFLPCGLVYAGLLKAVETASPAGGALSMLAFGAGTSGALLALGFFASAITSRLGRYANVLASASMVLLGAYLLYRGIYAGPPMMQGCPLHGHAS